MKYRCLKCSTGCEVESSRYPLVCISNPDWACDWKEVKKKDRWSFDPVMSVSWSKSKNKHVFLKHETKEIDQLKRFYSESLKTIEEQGEQLRVANEALEIVKSELDNTEKDLKKYRNSAENFRIENFKVTENNFKLRKEREELEKENNKLHKIAMRDSKERHHLKDVVESTSRLLESTTKELEKEKEKVFNLHEEIKALQKELNLTSKQRDEAMDKLIVRGCKIKNLEENIQVSDDLLKVRENNINKLVKENKELKEKLKVVRDTRGKLLNQRDFQIERLESEVEKYQSIPEVCKSRSEIERLEKELQVVKDDCDHLNRCLFRNSLGLDTVKDLPKVCTSREEIERLLRIVADNGKIIKRQSDRIKELEKENDANERIIKITKAHQKIERLQEENGELKKKTRKHIDMLFDFKKSFHEIIYQLNISNEKLEKERDEANECIKELEKEKKFYNWLEVEDKKLKKENEQLKEENKGLRKSASLEDIFYI